MKKVKIREVAEQIRGVSYTPADAFDAFLGNTIPLLRANNIQNLTANYNDLVYVRADKVGSKQLLKINDILICASSGSKHLVGKACVIKKEYGTFGAFCKVLRPNAQMINPAYFSHYFQSAIYRKTISELAAGANINNIKNEHLDELAIALPDMPTQEGIARKLDAICRLITLREQQLKKLDQLASSRFIEMFGDIVCNERIWPIYKFSNITSSRLGKMLDKKHQTGKNSFPYLANFNVRWFHFDLSELNKMDFDEQDQQEFSLEPGDLLVCEGGEVGRCAVWRGEKSQCFFQKALHRVRCDKALVHPIYLAWWFKNSADKNAFENISGAKATIAHLPGIKLKQLNVPLPPLELQNEFAAFIEQLDKSKVICNKMHKMVEFSLFRV